MIDFHYNTDFEIVNTDIYLNWLAKLIDSEEMLIGQIDYIFCDDVFLLEINKKYLNHDTYTDIITFDYTEGKSIAGDIFISVDRVKDNAMKFDVEFTEELHRVMAHGVLHLVGYGDKSDEEILVMRSKEEKAMKLFHVEQ